MELKFKVFDFETNEFAIDPSKYIKFDFYTSLNGAIHMIPKLKPNIPADLLIHIGTQDEDSIDIYEGDRLRFYSLIEDRYLIEEVTRHGILFHWTLGNHSFEEISNLKVVGHKYDGGTLQNLQKLL